MRVAKIESEPIIQDKVILVLGDGKRVGMQGLHKDSLRLKSAVVVGAEAKLVYDANTGQGAEDVSLEPEINKVITSTGGFYSLILSDGTRIWLNSESGTFSRYDPKSHLATWETGRLGCASS